MSLHTCQDAVYIHDVAYSYIIIYVEKTLMAFNKSLKVFLWQNGSHHNELIADK